MQEPQTWRELLGQIIEDPQKKQSISEELGVRTITLARWVNHESNPRPQNLRQLLAALPKYRDILLELISEEFDGFGETIEEDSSKEIPAPFYSRVFEARATTSDILRYWSITNLILQQALGQLDPGRLGMAIRIVRCMDPDQDHKIHSLRESVGLGTNPWEGNLEQSAMFLGAESLAGFVVSSCRSAAIQNLEEDQSLLPSQKGKHERSAAIYPIMYAGRIAGCLLVSSAVINYFLAQSRLALIKAYADLIALAFEPDEFYELEEIELRVMPHHDEQEAYFSNFRKRVAYEMTRASAINQPINSIQAEKLVWKQLEQELLNHVLKVGS